MSRLTLGYLTLGELAPADLVTTAAEGGFGSVGLRLTGRRKADPHVSVLGDPAAIRAIRRRLIDIGIRLSNVSAYYVTPDLRACDVAPVVDAAAELGAPLIIANRHDPDDGRYAALMGAYCEAATAAGIRLAIEFMRYSEARTVDEAIRSVELVGCDGFGYLVDPLHLSRSGGTPSDLARMEPRRIFLAQLCDARGPAPASAEECAIEARTGRLDPGEGDLPLFEFLDALPAAIEIECEVPQTRLAHRPAAERARRVAQTCRAFLDRYRAQRRPEFAAC